MSTPAPGEPERASKPAEDAVATTTEPTRTSKPGNAFSRWLHRHDRLVTILGAIIVFITFLTREAFREELKDLLESLDNAQSVFVLQDASASIQLRLSEIFQAVSATYSNVLKLPPGGVPQIDLLSVSLHTQATFDSIGRVSDQLAAVEGLVRKTPHDEQKNSEVKDLRKQLEDVTSAYKTFASKTWGSASSAEQIKAAFNSILGIENNARNLENGVTTFSSRFLTESRELYERKEHTFKWVTNGSYVSYTIGWALTLAGKLYGPKDKGTEEVE